MKLIWDGTKRNQGLENPSWRYSTPTKNNSQDYITAFLVSFKEISGTRLVPIQEEQG